MEGRSAVESGKMGQNDTVFEGVWCPHLTQGRLILGIRMVAQDNIWRGNFAVTFTKLT